MGSAPLLMVMRLAMRGWACSSSCIVGHPREGRGQDGEPRGGHARSGNPRLLSEHWDKP